MARSETSYYYCYTITNAITIIIDVSVVFIQLFTWSLKENTIPFTWKTSVICPVQNSNNNNNKLKRNSCLNDYRLIALTSIVMKCFERIILHRLMKHTKPHLDPYQFAYKQTEASKTLTLLHNAYTHLEKPGSFVRILFIDFSSAFNSIQPHLMASKLLTDSLDCRLFCQSFSDSSSPSCTLVFPLYFHRLSTRHCHIS